MDKSISPAEGELLQKPGTLKAADEDKIGGDVTWDDMCAQIPTTSQEYVNLQLNPERYTGYNGSHVWSAIYSENCFSGAAIRGHSLSERGPEASTDALCYEERVLYRLLSGMHSATNTHIAMSTKYKAKTKEWLPKPERFWQLFGNHLGC